jgi:hypothetical protein
MFEILNSFGRAVERAACEQPGQGGGSGWLAWANSCCGGWRQAYAGLAFNVANPWWGFGYPSYGYDYAYPYGYDLAATAVGLPLMAAAAATTPLVTGRSVAIHYCSTPITTCALRHAPYSCSCPAAGGRIWGTVSP